MLIRGADSLRYIVDRIEGNFAVCETEDMTTVSICLDELPPETKEGSVIEYQNDEYVIDTEYERERRDTLFTLQESIFDE